jgi:hypothetical protein
MPWHKLLVYSNLPLRCKLRPVVTWVCNLLILVEHYEFEVDQAAFTFFVCLVPVALDVSIKFWVGS